MLFAATFPERVDKLVLLEGGLPLTAEADDAPAGLKQALLEARALRGKSGRVFTHRKTAIAERAAGFTKITHASAEILARRSLREVSGGFQWHADQRLKAQSELRLTPEHVLWIERAFPWLIDWEAAGYINPAMELAETALRWAGLGHDAPSLEIVRAMRSGYRLAGPALATSARTALAGCAGSWLSELERAMLRSLDANLSANERALALADVADAADRVDARPSLRSLSAGGFGLQRLDDRHVAVGRHGVVDEVAVPGRLGGKRHDRAGQQERLVEREQGQDRRHLPRVRALVLIPHSLRHRKAPLSWLAATASRPESSSGS